MNDIQIFNNPEFGEIRTVIIDGEPWFVAKDISEKLGYSQVANMSKLIDSDDKQVISSSILDERVANGYKQAYQITIINESGIYAAIFGSKQENAKTFKKWVTSEVLPEIRKSGSYGKEKEPIALSTSQVDQNIRLLAQGHVELSAKVDAIKSDFDQFREDCPLFPVEAEQIVNAAKKKGVSILGGKDSEAYHDKSLVRSVYKDMYSQIHRNFSISTYKALSRKELERAISVIENYELPIALADKVNSANSQISLF